MTRRPVVAAGDRFGRLTVIGVHPERSRSGKRRYICACSCGRECVVASGSLVQGRTQSCGCLYRKPKSAEHRARIAAANRGKPKSPEHRAKLSASVSALPKVPAQTRFWRRVTIAGDQECWLWNGYIMPNGYGKFTPSRGVCLLAHRFSYESVVGPIPPGFDLDHVRERGCRHRHCVNPAHLEPVTRAENLRRSRSAD